MPAVRRVTIELDDKTAALFDRKVATGQFADDADVAMQAVSDMLLDELFDAMPLRSEGELETIFREAVADYLANPDEGQDLDECFDELEAKWTAEGRRA